MLSCEVLEQQFQAADDSIIDGKYVSDIASSYGLGENTLPENEKVWLWQNGWKICGSIERLNS